MERPCFINDSWNGKIYKSSEGCRSIYVDNQKVILDESMYVQLKEYSHYRTELINKHYSYIRCLVNVFVPFKIPFSKIARESDINDIDLKRMTDNFAEYFTHVEKVQHDIRSCMEILVARTLLVNNIECSEKIDFANFANEIMYSQYKDVFRTNCISSIRYNLNKAFSDKANEDAERRLLRESVRRSSDVKDYIGKHGEPSLLKNHPKSDWNGTIYGSEYNGFYIYLDNKKYILSDMDMSEFGLRKQ